jgi:hypothetical protein
METKKNKSTKCPTRWKTAAQLLSLLPFLKSERAIKAAVRRGELRGYQIGRALVFDLVEVEAAIRSGRVS